MTFDKETRSEDNTNEESNPRRQLQRTHLRIHIKPPKILRVREGSDEFLECQAGGSPAPDVHWLKDGMRIAQGSNDVPKSSSDVDNNSEAGLDVSFTTSRLFLDCLSLEDEAEYTCVAENPYQRTSTTTRVSVLTSDEEITCTQNSHGQSPRIHTWTKTMIASQGEQTRLRCRADGYPRPTIRWLGAKQEELARADVGKYEILSNGDLIIRNLQWSDMGNYACVAENIHGENKVEAFLYPAVPDP